MGNLAGMMWGDLCCVCGESVAALSLRGLLSQEKTLIAHIKKGPRHIGSHVAITAQQAFKRVAAALLNLRVLLTRGDPSRQALMPKPHTCTHCLPLLKQRGLH